MLTIVTNEGYKVDSYSEDLPGKCGRTIVNALPKGELTDSSPEFRQAIEQIFTSQESTKSLQKIYGPGVDPETVDAFNRLAVWAGRFGIPVPGRKKAFKQAILSATSKVVTNGIQSVFTQIDEAVAQEYDKEMASVYDEMQSLDGKLGKLNKQVDVNKTQQDKRINELAQNLISMRTSIKEQELKMKRLSHELKEKAEQIRANAAATGEAQQTADAAIAHGAQAQCGWWVGVRSGHVGLACAVDGGGGDSPRSVSVSPVRGTTPPTALHIPERRVLAAG